MKSGAYEIPSRTHLLVMPTYNTGEPVTGIVQEALVYWKPVWVVVDGSDDGTDKLLKAMAHREPNLRVLVSKERRGKGAAVLHALDLATKKGYTHVLCMDADGQHPAAKIRDFMGASFAQPEAMILAAPVFDAATSRWMIFMRRLAGLFTKILTLGADVKDAFCGFRLVPLEKLRAIMHQTNHARGYDFDAETAVRLIWSGVRPVNLPTPIRAVAVEGAVASHYEAGKDSLRLVGMYLRLSGAFFKKLFTANRWRRWREPKSS
jgi:glycosyltransferase involved in cell wall biosynthesis